MSGPMTQWADKEIARLLLEQDDSAPTPMLKPWRCPSCNTILAKMSLRSGSVIEIKCPRCNVMAIKEAA